MYGGNLIDSTVHEQPNLSTGFVMGVSASLSEISTLQGIRYYTEIHESFTTTPRYFLYNAPAVVDQVTLELLLRDFKTTTDECTIRILWDTAGFTLGTEYLSWNENNKVSLVPNTALTTIHEISTPSTLGVTRETDTVGSAGTPSKSSGGISSGVGTRVYAGGTNFVLEVTSASTQVVHIAYSFVERPNELYPPLE